MLWLLIPVGVAAWAYLIHEWFTFPSSLFGDVPYTAGDDDE